MFIVILKCFFITIVIAKEDRKPKRRAELVALYNNLDAAKLDLMMNGIHSVPVVKLSGNPKYSYQLSLTCSYCLSPMKMMSP